MSTIKGKGFTLNWKGDEVVDEMLGNMEAAIGEFGLRAEGKAKTKLRPSERIGKTWVKGGGHGKRTAHLQRSIHTAQPGHSWAGEDGASEMGGKLVQAGRKGLKVVLEFGSGLLYALKIHQEHNDPVVHHFLTDAVDETKPELPEILEKHKLK